MPVEQKNEGITTNPYRIIQATTNIGPHASIVEESTASYGVVAEVFGPNQIIMDTGYFPMNELVGGQHLDVRWFSSVNSGIGLTVEFWRKDPSGIEVLSYSSDIPWYGDVSSYYGGSAGNGYFNVNFQYRFVIKSHSSVATTTSIGVDWFKITIVDHWGVSTTTQYTNFDNVPMDIMMYGEVIAVDGDNSTNVYHTDVITDFDATQASIVATPSWEYVIVAITGKSTTGYTVTCKHKDDINWTGRVYVNVVAFCYPFFESI